MVPLNTPIFIEVDPVSELGQVLGAGDIGRIVAG
jgi:hypothetical protein